MFDLSENDLQILGCWLSAWDNSNHKLPGGLCYRQVMDLADKLGLDKPTELAALCEDPEKYLDDVDGRMVRKLKWLGVID